MTSPCTNLRLTSTEFTDNIALRQTIDEWKVKRDAAADIEEAVERHAKRTCMRPIAPPDSLLEEKLLLAGVGLGQVKSVLQLLEEEMRQHQVRPTPEHAEELEKALWHNKLEGLRSACVSCGITFDAGASDADMVLLVLDMVHGYPGVASRGLRALGRFLKKKNTNPAVHHLACNVVLTTLRRFLHHSDIVEQCCEVMASTFFKTKELTEHAMSTGVCEGLVLAMKLTPETVLPVFKKLLENSEASTHVVAVSAMLTAKAPKAVTTSMKDCFRWPRHYGPNLAREYCEVLRVFAKIPDMRKALVETGVIGVLHLVRPCNLPIDIMCDLAELPDGVVQMANSHTHKFLVQAMSEFPENACTVLSKLIKKERPDTPTLDWMYAEGGWGALIKVLGRQAQGYVVITKAMELISLVMKKWRLRGRGCGYGGVAQDYDVMAAVVTKCTSLYISDEHIRTTGCDIMSELLLVDGDGGVEYGERVCRPLIDAGACEIIWHAFLMGTPKALFLLGNLWIFGHGRITKAARGLRKIAEALVRLAPGSAMALRILYETGQAPVGTLGMATGILRRFPDNPSFQLLAIQILNRLEDAELQHAGDDSTALAGMVAEILKTVLSTGNVDPAFVVCTSR